MTESAYRVEWRVSDVFGDEWRICVVPAHEQPCAERSVDWEERSQLDRLVMDGFTHSGATDDRVARILVEIYDELTNGDLSNRLPVPTDDRQRLLCGIDHEILHTLLSALTSGALRVERIARAPFPFPDRPSEPVEPHLDAAPVNEQTMWIGIRLVDQDGEAVANQQVRIVESNGAENITKLSSNGRLRAEGLASGTCNVSLVDIDYRDVLSPSAKPLSKESVIGGPYTVRQGDTVPAVAVRNGFLWSNTLWSAAKNADLRKKRSDPNVLLPGDTLYILDRQPPTFALATGAEYTITVQRSKLTVKLRLLDWLGNVRSGEECAVSFAGQDDLPLTADDDGKISFEVPADVRTAKVKCKLGDEFPLAIGGLNPPETLTGVGARLRNLGFYGTATDSLDASLEHRLALAFAVELFADLIQTTPSDDTNDAFADRIRKEYGT